MARFVTRSVRAADTTGPTAPTITATGSSPSSITINRTVVATDVSGILNYETQRSPTGAGNWSAFDTSGLNPVTATGLAASTIYDFRQRAFDTLGNAGDFSATVSASTQASDFRFTPDYYVSSSATGSGNGSLGSPWSPAQALALQTAQTVVGRHTYICWLPGNGGLYTRASDTTHNVPAFAPQFSGRSASEKIIHFTQYAGSKLANALTNPLRTELAHTGTGDGLTTTDDKSHIGFRDVSFCEWDGPVLNDANGTFEIDGGAVLARGDSSGCVDCAIRSCYIRATTRSGSQFSNYSAVWNDRTLRLEFTDNYVTGFRYAVADNHNTTGLTLYGAQNILVSNNWFNDCYVGTFVKGAPLGVFNSGIIEKNIYSNCEGGIDMQDIDPAATLIVRHNVIYAAAQFGINYGNSGSTFSRNTRVYNNTIVVDAAGGSFTYGMFSGDANNFSTSNWLHDNIIVVSVGSSRHGVDTSGSTALFARLRSNLYYFGGASGRWQWNSTLSTSVAAWQAALQAGGNPSGSRDESAVQADPLFADAASRNYALSGGSPALTMGSVDGVGGAGGQIGAYAGGVTVGIR